jgi:steroid delta-isomerase-like uncharacterized protein
MASHPLPSGVTNAELVRWAFDRLNECDLESLKQFWNADTVERFPTGTVRGTDAIAEYFAEAFAALADWHMEVVALVQQDDDVFVHWQLTGTHSGRFQGLAATGRHVTLDGMDHFVVRDGRLISNFVVFDQMQFARAVGMLPADGTRGDRAAKSAFNARTKLAARLRRI